MTAVVDGMSLRDALHRICEPVAVNLCLDRRVDPSSPVNPGPVGPTIFAALKKIAETRHCVVMPVCHVVLVGRPSWVDATAASLLAATADGASDGDVRVAWSELTTGAEALAAVMNRDRADVRKLGLPHDVWAANEWKQIDRRVAVSLVLAQFDLQLAGPVDANTDQIVAKPFDATVSLERTYSADIQPQLLRRTIESSDAESRFFVDQDMLRVKATAAAHRIGTEALLGRWAESVSAKTSQDSKTFTLRRTETSAGAALMQFARAAGRQCIIEPDAIEACRKQIDLEAENETLKSLINRVAREAGVLVKWHDKKIVVTTLSD